MIPLINKTLPRQVVFLVFLFMLAACRPAVPPATPTPISSAMSLGPHRPGSLSAKGPWILYAVKDTGRTSWGPALANPDGSGFTPLDVPLAQQASPKLMPVQVAPGGGFLAIQTQESELDFQLWLVKLPEAKVVNKIALLSPAAQKAIQEFQPTDAEPALPEPYILKYEMHALWSPDGRYLAFSARMDTSSLSLYLYDTHTNAVKRLTGDSAAQVVALSWSPDSKRIVYQTVKDYSTPNKNVETVRAISVNGQPDKELYQSGASWEAVAAWASNHELLVYDQDSEIQGYNLRKVDLDNGQSVDLFQGFFYKTAYDAKGSILVIEIGSDPNVQNLVDAGLYQISLQTGELKPLSTEEWKAPEWVPQLGVFTAIKNGNYPDRQVFDLQGKPGPAFMLGIFLPSPDGRWINVTTGLSFKLYTRDGKQVKESTLGSPLAWLPDSSGFYTATDGKLVRYMESNGWTAEQVDEGLQPETWVKIVNP